MNNERLKLLLEAATQNRLTEVEETELAHLLENPANREILDQELAATRGRFAALHDYQQALRAKEPEITEATLRTLLASLPRESSAHEPSNLLRFRRWGATAAFFGAMAACLVLVFWLGGERAPGPRVFEFGVVATMSPMRSPSGNVARNLGSKWKVSSLKDLQSLTMWSAADLPANVSARVWIDEEAGKIRAVYRRSDGTVTRTETVLDVRMSVENQLRRFAAELGGTP